MYVSRLFYFMVVFCFLLQTVTCGINDLRKFMSPEDVALLEEAIAIYSEEFDDSVLSRKYTPFNATGTTDCYGVNRLTNIFRLIVTKRRDASNKVNVDFYLRNRNTKQRVKLVANDTSPSKWKDFKSNKPTVVIVHGFHSYSEADWIKDMTNALLEWDDVNVILVDWSKGASSQVYWNAVDNTRTVASDMAIFLTTLKAVSGQDNIHLIGHSLGAHICGYAANILGGVRRITGLDPAQPCYETDDLKMKLDKSDADFVDVIHTNAKQLKHFGLGLYEPCGHQDFYPNGGKQQTGCEPDEEAGIIQRTIESVFLNICNHGRAYLLFTSSLKKHNCKLIGHKWDLNKESQSKSLQTPCDATNCSEMGVKADLSTARGVFYLQTTAKEPYC